LIEFEWFGSGWSRNTSSSAFWSVGDYAGATIVENQSEAQCLEPPGTMLFYRGITACGTPFTGPITLPFVLGAPFEMAFQVRSKASGFDYEPKLTMVDLFVNFRLTELDGTPVDVHLVPEPGSWALTAIGLLALVATQRLRPTAAGWRGRR
jgi:hypothetical protein